MNNEGIYHPLLDGDYVIPTIATEAASKFVGDVLKARLPGSIIYGKQRFGKSRSIRQTIVDLQHDFGANLVVISLQAEYAAERPKEAWHYEYCLKCIDHLLPNGKATEVKARFQEAIVARVSGSGQRRLVLIYDDAQFLWEHQYGFLMNDYNYFEKKGVKPTYVLVGQDELMLQRQSFILAKRNHLIGRFMVRFLEFHGVRNVTDMKDVLISYDERSEFPVGSGICFSRFFFPAAFEAGWRIASLAERIFKAYKKLRREHSIPERRDIPMQYLVPVIELIMREQGDREILEPIINDQWLEDAIVSCGYVSAECSN